MWRLTDSLNHHSVIFFTNLITIHYTHSPPWQRCLRGWRGWGGAPWGCRVEWGPWTVLCWCCGSGSTETVLSTGETAKSFHNYTGLGSNFIRLGWDSFHTTVIEPSHLQTGSGPPYTNAGSRLSSQSWKQNLPLYWFFFFVLPDLNC